MIVDLHSGGLSSPRKTEKDVNYVVVSASDGTAVVVVVNYHGKIYVSTAEDKDFPDIIKSLRLSDVRTADTVEKMLCKK